MIKIVSEFNASAFERVVNQHLVDGYEIFDIKIITNPNGSNATWIAILKKADLKGE